MKILVVHNTYKVSGGEDTVVKNEIQLLQNAGVEVVTYIRSNEETQGGIFHKLMVPLRAIYNPKTVREVRNLIRREKPDLMHVHNTLLVVSPSVYIAAFREKIPVIQTLHNFRMVCPNALLLRDGKVCRECLERGLGCGVKHGCYRGSKLQSLMSAAILWIHRKKGTYNRLNYICLTEFNRQIILSQNGKNGLNIDPERVFVRPNFVNEISGMDAKYKASIETQSMVMDMEDKASIGTQSMGMDAKDNIPTCDKNGLYTMFTYVGRLSVEKGTQILIEGWKKYREMGGSYQLAICGDGPMKNLVEKALENNVAGLNYLGKISHDKAMTVMSESAAVLLPSICYEGMPMTLCESFSVGTPVIGSNLGNVGGCISVDVNGNVFEPGNPEALAKCLLAFEKEQESNPITRERLGRQARETFEQLYTQSAATDSLLKIYDKVLSRERA